MKQSTINYCICTLLLGVGIVLVLSNELSTIIMGVLWFVILHVSSTNKVLKRMWKSYWKTNIKTMMMLGIY